MKRFEQTFTGAICTGSPRDADEYKIIRFADDGQIAELSLSTKWEPNYVTIEKMRARAEKIGRELGRKEGEEIGEKRGLEKGREEGEKKRALEIATEMKRNGIDPATIEKVTGLSEDTINKLS